MLEYAKIHEVNFGFGFCIFLLFLKFGSFFVCLFCFYTANARPTVRKFNIMSSVTVFIQMH